MGLCGCNTGEGTKTEEEIVMTNEQVIIARKLGMSTNYEELSNADKNKLERVEELLDYLEEKYGKEFVFEDYQGSGLLYDEELKVHPEDDRDCQVTLTIDGTTEEFIDDYAWLYYEDEYREMITNFFEEEIGNNSIKVYFDLAYVNPEKINLDIKAGEVQIDSAIYIFINGDYSENETNELTEMFVEWMRERGDTGAGRVIIVKNNSDFINLSNFNNAEYMREGSYKVRIDFKIDKTGDSSVEAVVRE